MKRLDLLDIVVGVLSDFMVETNNLSDGSRGSAEPGAGGLGFHVVEEFHWLIVEGSAAAAALVHPIPVATVGWLLGRTIRSWSGRSLRGIPV